MKTNALITRKTPLNSLIVIIGLLITSCGSYQNSSYYDSDGIYSTNTEKVVVKNNHSNQTSDQYKQYFNSLQNTGASNEIFTDVNSYNSDYNTYNDSIQLPSTGYASWGSSPKETTITVYPETSWYIGYNGWSRPYYGYGYSYPYYGYGWGYPYYGWTSPYYGWGYSGYGWDYYNYSGYQYSYSRPAASTYSYNNSRRGSSYGGNYPTTRRGSYSNTRDSFGGRNSSTGRNSDYSTYNRNSIYDRNSMNDAAANRRGAGFISRNSYSNSASRNFTPNQSQSRNSNYTQNRTNTATSNQNTQRSSYAPSSSSSYRSSSSSSSSNSSSSNSNMSSGSSRMSSGGNSGGGGGRTGGGRR